VKRTLGAAMLFVGLVLAVASIGFVFTWPLGMVVGVCLIVSGASLTRNPEAWI
jgi:uncharacterized membrane protein